MATKRVRERMSGLSLFGIVIFAFNGSLAFMNAVMATELLFQVLFALAGVVLVGVAVWLLMRWYFSDASAEQERRR